jgi:hypothetical protein
MWFTSGWPFASAADIVILDNLGARKSRNAALTIRERVGHRSVPRSGPRKDIIARSMTAGRQSAKSTTSMDRAGTPQPVQGRPL